MLLGQAESGKSTLQKQFQLLYASQSLEHERPSWRPVVYFNIIKALRMILDSLDSEDIVGPARTESGAELASIIRITAPVSLADLRGALLPLIAMENELASHISGGVSLTGGRTGAYVRTGWQALVDPTGKLSPDKRTASMEAKAAAMFQVTESASHVLGGVREEVSDLWQHPAVRRLLQLRKLRLEEGAALLVRFTHRQSH